VTGETIQPVTSGQIYMGSLPYLGIQLAMVIIVIAFPQLVTHYKSGRVAVDPSTIELNVPMPGEDGANPFGTPAAPFGAEPSEGEASPPAFDAPAPDFGSPTPSFGSPEQNGSNP
jgi:hypothetical protein